MLRIARIFAMIGVMFAGACGVSVAQDYPNKPIRWVVPYPPSGTTDVMVVSNSVPAKTVAEFITYCKANPGKVNMASSGSGTSVHLSGELFKFMTGWNMLHVPYKGAGPALIDLTAGQVDVLFDNLPSSVPHIKGNIIRALAVTSAAAEPSFSRSRALHA
jgi:tripartite-type tricarboxylate transporter receptor subunit TctC